jgi:hypothetical protein
MQVSELHLSKLHRVRVLRFLEQQSAVVAVGTVPPAAAQKLEERAQEVIDVMAVRDCHRWNAEIAWQSVRELLRLLPMTTS